MESKEDDLAAAGANMEAGGASAGADSEDDAHPVGEAYDAIAGIDCVEEMSSTLQETIEKLSSVEGLSEEALEAISGLKEVGAWLIELVDKVGDLPDL